MMPKFRYRSSDVVRGIVNSFECFVRAQDRPAVGGEPETN